jgi:hypothetical protein
LNTKVTNEVIYLGFDGATPAIPPVRFDAISMVLLEIVDKNRYLDDYKIMFIICDPPVQNESDVALLITE